MLAFIGYCIAVGIIARLHSWAVGSLLEKKVNIIIFLFSASSLCPQSTVQVSSAETFENISDPTKCSCANACICSFASAGLIIVVVLN